MREGTVNSPSKWDTVTAEGHKAAEHGAPGTQGSGVRRDGRGGTAGAGAPLETRADSATACVLGEGAIPMACDTGTSLDTQRAPGHRGRQV